MTSGRGGTAALLVASGALLAGCEDSAAGFAGGIGMAIGLLLLVALVLPAAMAGLIIVIVTTVRRNRDRSGPR